MFRKVSDRCEPPGLERTILGKLPMAWLSGTLVPAFMAGFNRLVPREASAREIARELFFVDALAIGAVITVWTAVLTVAIGCCVVIVMKGPHYAADSYHINDASKPDPD